MDSLAFGGKSLILVALLGTWSSSADAAPPPEQLLPGTTREFFASPSIKQLRQNFRETPMGRLLNDPLLEPFNNDLQQQAEQGNEVEFLGFTLNDLSLIGPGESAWAKVEVGPRQPAEVLLLEVAGKHKRLEEVLAERGKRWQEAGGRERTETRKGILLTIQEKLVPTGSGGTPEVRVHCLKDNLLIVSDTVPLIDAVLERWEGSNGSSLSDLPAFKSIQDRTRSQGEQKIQLRFFVDPFGLWDLERSAPRKKDRWQQLRKAGLDGIKGLGGFLSFNAGGNDLFYHVAVVAPRPLRKGMGVFQFLEGSDFTPPAWVQVPLSVYTMVNLDLDRAFGSLGPIYDQIVVNGEEGTFLETLDDLKKDPKVKLDVRREIIAQLGSQVHLLRDSTEPTTRNSERFLAAIPVKNARVVADALARFYQSDDRVKRRTFQDRCTIWETADQKKESRRLPYHAVTVSASFFYLSTSMDLLEAVLRRENEKDNPHWLGQQADYQSFIKEAARLGGGRAASYQFSWLAQDLRGVYELTRRNELEGADSLYAELLLRFLDRNKIKLKGELLPEFSKISHYLGTAGNFVRTTPEGWEIIGFHPRKSK